MIFNYTGKGGCIEEKSSVNEKKIQLRQKTSLDGPKDKDPEIFPKQKESYDQKEKNTYSLSR